MVLTPAAKPTLAYAMPESEAKKYRPGAQGPRSATILYIDDHFTLEFPMGHRLLFGALRRSMTACFQVVSARLCDFPDLPLD
ncbi:hypothetical protein NGUA41_03731 [Salmonella enterica]|nr:hypothetical protein NGUA40_00659 [Salmonella enterica]GAS78841.1 hypothetical protein NGUA41_03731 [Salmonella enterica]